jgi:hypothetical protein
MLLIIIATIALLAISNAGSVYDRVWVTDPAAKCLDGSPLAYYIA